MMDYDVSKIADIGRMDDDISLDLADLFRIFGDSTRIRILWLLRSGEKCVEEISSGAGITMSACSHQLKTLRDAHLVSARREGKRVNYSLSDEHVEILLTIALEHLLEKDQ